MKYILISAFILIVLPYCLLDVYHDYLVSQHAYYEDKYAEYKKMLEDSSALLSELLREIALKHEQTKHCCAKNKCTVIDIDYLHFILKIKKYSYIPGRSEQGWGGEIYRALIQVHSDMGNNSEQRIRFKVNALVSLAEGISTHQMYHIKNPNLFRIANMGPIWNYSCQVDCTKITPQSNYTNIDTWMKERWSIKSLNFGVLSGDLLKFNEALTGHIEIFNKAKIYQVKETAYQRRHIWYGHFYQINIPSWVPNPF